MDKQDVSDIRDRIILAALPRAAFDGWTWAVIEGAAQDAGYEAAMAGAVMPGRVKDALDGFADLADRQMLLALAQTDIEALRVRERIRAAVLARFAWLAPHKEALRRSVQFWIPPARKPRGAKIIWRSADRIWNWAGDDATGYHRYTKRGLLSAIIVAATLAWLSEPGENTDKLHVFIDRRIENVMELGRIVNKIKQES